MPLYHTNPPGFISLTEVVAQLRMSKPTFYRLGLADPDFVDSWQTGQNTPRLYRAADVALLRAWLRLLKGFIALGLPQGSEPINSSRWRYYVEVGGYDQPCPRCGSAGVADRRNGRQRVWCQVCGITEDGSDQT
jgi:hypothetical protein